MGTAVFVNVAPCCALLWLTPFTRRLQPESGGQCLFGLPTYVCHPYWGVAYCMGLDGFCHLYQHATCCMGLDGFSALKAVVQCTKGSCLCIENSVLCTASQRMLDHLCINVHACCFMMMWPVCPSSAPCAHVLLCAGSLGPGGQLYTVLYVQVADAPPLRIYGHKTGHIAL